MLYRRGLLLGALAITLVVAGCDGGNDDSSPTPTPSGTATPTPTPTATSTVPTYATFPLTAVTQFAALDATTNFSGDLAAGAVTLGVAGSEGRTDRVTLAVQPTIGTGEFVIRESTEESRFTTTNAITPSAAANPEYVFRTTGDAGRFSQVEFLNNTIANSVTSDAALARTRVSYANWYRGDSTTGQKRLTYTVFGYPTLSTDVPTTGTVAYTSRVVGRVVRANASGAGGTLNRLGGTVTMSINYATGLVSMTLNLANIAADGTQTAYSTFTGQGSIAVGATQFSGSFGAGSPLGGTFNGSLFGTQGAEIGISFALSGAIAGTEQRAVGVVIGARS